MRRRLPSAALAQGRRIPARTEGLARITSLTTPASVSQVKLVLIISQLSKVCTFVVGLFTKQT